MEWNGMEKGEEIDSILFVIRALLACSLTCLCTHPFFVVRESFYLSFSMYTIFRGEKLRGSLLFGGMEMIFWMGIGDILL
jgi:hypothetical protein